MCRSDLAAFTRFPKWFTVAIISLLSFIVWTQPVRAQQTLGAITGTVTDPSGAVVSDATVRALNLATNLEVSARTKTNGAFVIPDLPAGPIESLSPRTASKRRRTRRSWCSETVRRPWILLWWWARPAPQWK